jgi:hypothetical protein
MNPDHFRDSPSGRLVRIGQGETAYWAFVPSPLPPDLAPATTAGRFSCAWRCSTMLTIPQAQRLLGVTYPSAQRNVKRLVEAGILRQVGESSYGKTFVASEILDVISER